jgi:hypothetical protein
MEGIRTPPRRVLKALALATVLAVALPVTLACELNESTHADKAAGSRVAGEGKQPENRAPAPERCKRSDKNNNAKSCPAEGGERVPQDKRSPLDDAPPLAPLVA